MIRSFTFEVATQKLADAGYLPARIWKQRQLDNETGAEVLLASVTDEKFKTDSPYLAYFDVLHALRVSSAMARELAERMIATDPAHLMARQLLEQLAIERSDDWEKISHRTAREELDPEGIHNGIPSEVQTTQISVQTSSTDNFVLTLDEQRLLRQTPVVTETLADLFRDQGHHRMASAMYKHLLTGDYTATIHEKLNAITRQSTTVIRTRE